MDRVAIFVDAGYVYAQGGMIALGTKSRALVQLDVSGFVTHLEQVSRSAVSVPILRTYWYDGAPDRVATSEQHEVAKLSDVKLRLGSLSRGKQKGVDALIYRDLITLAREKAISDAVLVAGDADLCEGVRAAQELGVRVVVVGLSSRRGQRQARELLHEADRSHQLADADISSFFTRRVVVAAPPPASAAVASAPATPAATATGPGTPAATPPVTTTPQVAPTTTARGAPANVASGAAPVAAARDLAAVEAAARGYAVRWLSSASPGDVAALRSLEPRIPTPIDSALLQAVEAVVRRSMRLDQPARYAARRGFWDEIRSDDQATRNTNWCRRL